jgi:enterochelin esterase-like enzyme
MPQIKRSIFTLVAAIALLVVGCDPLAAPPTQQVLIITAIPTATPPPTATPTPTRTPVPTLTPLYTPTPIAPPCDEEHGNLIQFNTFPSEIADENLRYHVYTPPCYQKSGKRYPYVILIHGASQKEDEWEKLGVVQIADQGFTQGTLSPMILVMPYYGSIGNDNIFPPDPSYENVILEELVPVVERDFCTFSDRQHRAIGGISRGGFWAYSIGMRHPDIFGIIGGHSAYFTEDLDVIPADFNPFELAATSSALRTTALRLYLDNGADDPAGRVIQAFSSRLTLLSIPHTYVINPVGQHDEQYWSVHVSEYLNFYGRAWPRRASELPSCLEPSPSP